MKMKIVQVLSLFILTLFFTPVFGQEVNEVKAPGKIKKKENFYLYLIVGGSNMLVKNTFPSSVNKDDSRIFLSDDGKNWVSAEDHKKSSEGRVEQEKGTGPSIFFAEAILTAKRDKEMKIGLINCAEKDSELTDWMKGGKYYEKAVETTKIAMGTGVVKGILWHQANPEMKKSDPLKYAETVGEIAANLRKDLNSPDYLPFPFVGGKLVSHPYLKESDEFKELNKILQKTFSDTDRSGLVESKGLKDSGDGIHFDAEAMGELGKRYADAIIYLEGRKLPPSKKNPEGKKK